MNLMKIMTCLALLAAGTAFGGDAYIESDGTSYIDTGYWPSTNTSVYADFEWRDTTAQQFVFECGDSVNATNSSYKTYFRHYISGTGYNAWAMNRQLWQNTGVRATVGQRCQVLLDGPGLNVTFATPTATNSVAQPSWSRSHQATGQSLKLFSSGAGNGNKAKARIYEVRIYEAGELVCDFLPATRDGLIGFYDEISGEFICNKSGFTFGGVESLPEVPEGPYIESNGTAGINTGVQCQPGLKVEVDFRITVPFEQMVAQWRIVATDADDKHPRLSAYVNASTNIALSSGDAWASSTSTGIRADTQRHKVILGAPGNKCYYTIGNSAQATISGNAFTKKSLTQIALLATPKANFGATFSNTAKARLYGAKFWVGEKLIRDFRPRTVDGVAGLEDVVQGGFYTSDGYTASADTPEGLTSTPAYIENDGSFFSYVNTYYCASPKTKVSVDYQMVKLEASKIVWGTYGSSVGLTTLMWHDSSAWAYPQAKNDSYSTPTMSPKMYMDSGRHTSIVDIPAQRLAVLDSTGAVESEGTMDMPTKSAVWPILLFTGSKDKYGHPYNTQIATCRIYGAKIWEKEGDEYVLKHNFEPVLLAGIPGFWDAVTGKFHSGDKLKAGGPVPDMADDSYVENPDGGRFFDTGYFATTNTSVWMDFMPLVQQASQQFPYEAGVANQNGQMFLRAYANGSAGTGDFSHAFGIDTYKTTYVPYQPNVRVQVFNDTVNKRFSVLRDGVELGGTNYATWAASGVTKVSSKTLKLLCNNDMNSNSCRARLYGVKIYEAGKLVRDYRPIKQAGSPALFDQVTGKILQKASNSKEFTSNIKTATDGTFYNENHRADDVYIQSDRTQGINTGYYATPNTRFEVDYQMVSIRGQNRIFGVGSGAFTDEMYIQGENEGAGNVAFGTGDSWKGQYTNKGSDTQRHTAFLDIYNLQCGYAGTTLKFDTATVCTKTATIPTTIFAKGTSTTADVFATTEAKHKTEMRLYAFRIYEADELVHQFLPYKNGDDIGLYDTVTGEVKYNVMANGNAFTYGGVRGYGKYAGAPAKLVTVPQGAEIASGETTVLSAYVPGAIKYVWAKNGEVIAGETDETLSVDWERRKRSDNIVTYAVRPIFLVDGQEVAGDEASADVTMKPLGAAIIIR